MKGFKLRIWLSLGLIIAGSVGYEVNKLQNIQRVDDIYKCVDNDKHPQSTQFFHPILQTFLMFFGESLCLIYIVIWKKINPNKFISREDYAKFSGRYKVRWTKYILPAAFDFLSSLLQYVAVNIIDGSTFNFIRSGTIFTTGLFAFRFTRTRLKRHQKYGCIIVFMALIVIASSSLLDQLNQEFSDKKDWLLVSLGIFLTLVSIVLNGYYLAYEQKLFESYYVEPFEMVGYQGLIGMVFSSVLVLITNFIECPFPKGCVCAADNKRYMEHVRTFLLEITSSNNYILLILTISMIFIVSVFNILGVYTTQKLNALARSVINASKAILITIIGIVITVQLGGKYEQYQFESLDTYVLLVKGVGIAFLFFGMSIYNQLIKIRCLSEPESPYESSLLESEYVL